MKSQLMRKVFLLASVLLLVFISPRAICADIASNVEKILKDIRQDQPLPKLDYLNKATRMNEDSAYATGRYQDIEVTVECHPNSAKVASVLLRIPGLDQTRKILPAVTRVIGKPHQSDRKASQYAWEWPKYRTGSLHYDAGERMTIVSLFYR